MDFLDPKKKKASIRRLYVGYFLMAILIMTGALVLLFASYGYGVDKSGNVIQNGLVFLASSPDAAKVNIENKDSSYKRSVVTQQRMVLNQGEYRFEFLKEGYRSWHRTIEIKGGDLQRLDYSYLFPVELTSKAIRAYSSKPSFASTSPSRELSLVQQPGSLESFNLVDLSSDKITYKNINFPVTVFPGAGVKTKIELIEWSNDNRHLLVFYMVAGKKQFVLLDIASPSDSVNLNLKYSGEFSDVRLRDKKAGDYYLLDTKKRLLFAGDDPAKIKQIATNVEDFQPHGTDTVLFIDSKDVVKTNKVLARIWVDNEQIYTVRDLPKSKTYLLDIARYSGDWLVAVGAPVGRGEVYVYRDPIGNIKRHNEATFSTRTIKLEDVQKIKFSANTRFISAQSGQKFVVYDAEEDTQFHYEIKSKFDEANQVEWMDGHRLMGVSAGKVVIFDFDGENFQTLNGAVGDLQPAFNPSYKHLIAITKTKDPKAPYVLQSTDMRPTEN